MTSWFWAIFSFSKKRRVAADPARPAAGAVELGPQDEVEIKKSDHLTLGLNLDGLREACELVGFRYGCYKDGLRPDAWAYNYKRSGHPEMKWLYDAYPNDHSGVGLRLLLRRQDLAQGQRPR